MITLFVLLSLPFDTGRFWVSSPALPGAGLLTNSPAALASLGKIVLYAEGGWLDGPVPGPFFVGFNLPGTGTLWLEGGNSFAYFSQKEHIVRDDSSEVDRITQRTSMMLYTVCLGLSRSRGAFSWSIEALAGLGLLSDEFSSATGTIFPDEILVSSSPLAFGGGAGVLLDAGVVSAGLHGRYWADFLTAQREFQGDSLNSFVLRETVIPDSLTRALPLELGLHLFSRPTGISGEFLYRGQAGGAVAYERAFGPLSLKLIGGWMGDPLFMGNASFGLGKFSLGLRGGYWAGPRAGGFLFYRI